MGSPNPFLPDLCAWRHSAPSPPPSPPQAWLPWALGFRRTRRRMLPTCTASSCTCRSPSTSCQARWAGWAGQRHVLLERWPALQPVRQGRCIGALSGHAVRLCVCMAASRGGGWPPRSMEQCLSLCWHAYQNRRPLHGTSVKAGRIGCRWMSEAPAACGEGVWAPRSRARPPSCLTVGTTSPWL